MGRYRIEIISSRKAWLRDTQELTLYPLARGCLRHHLGQCGLQFFDGSHVWRHERDIEATHLAHNLEVVVWIDQARCDRPPACVDSLGIRAHQSTDLRIGTHRLDESILHRHGLRSGVAGIDGDDFAVEEQQVRRQFGDTV